MKLREVIDVGDTILCDLCNKDWTDSKETGGFLFLSKGVCPDCAPEFLEKIRQYNEEEYIKEFCPPDMSFSKWCLALRGGDNTIKFYTN